MDGNLPLGWVTDKSHELTAAQQLTALGNGVLPAQADGALDHLLEAAQWATQGR